MHRSRPATLRPSLVLLALGTAIPLAGCGRDEVVLQGVPPTAILQEAPKPGPAAPVVEEPGREYGKPAGVHVDVQHLGGRSFSEYRDVLGDQLGSLLENVELPGNDGREYRFERGTVRVSDDRVYMLRVPLPEPLRRTDAMVLLGFPAQADDYLILHREYRLNNEFGFRRIRLKRLDRESELVTEVEAWEQVPGEPVTLR